MSQGVVIFLLTIVPYEISTEYDEYDGPCIAMKIIQDLLKLRGQVTQVYHLALLWFRVQLPEFPNSGWRRELGVVDIIPLVSFIYFCLDNEKYT